MQFPGEDVMIRDFLADNSVVALAAGGFVIGLVYGAVVYKTNFCTMGGLSDFRAFGDRRRLYAWVLAVAVAMTGTQLLAVQGVVQLDKAMYTAPTINWAGNLLGGLMFGYGMVFAGGCPSRNAARLGGGDLRSLVTLAMTGLVAYMAIGGIFSPARTALEGATAVTVTGSNQTLPALLGAATGVSPDNLSLILGLGLAAALAAVCLSDRNFATSPKHVVSGLTVGLCVVAGWALTGLAFDELSSRPVAPVSLTFVRPAGDTLEWMARYTALGAPAFGVATLFGVVLGAAVMALMMGRFRLAGFSDTDDTVRHLMGAVLMGVGGVMALGCTIGQGVTGISTLAVGSFLAVASIVAGGWLGLAALERRIEATV